MTEAPSDSLTRALATLRAALVDPEGLVSAVAAGRQRGARPEWRRVELRYVDLRAGRHLQVTSFDERQAHTRNHPVGEAAVAAVDALLDAPFGTWRVETTDRVHQLRVTKKGEGLLHTATRTAPVEAERAHDRDKERLLAPDDPLLVSLGIATRDGRVKAGRQGKYHQVEEFVRQLDAALAEAFDKGHLRRPTPEEPLRVVDLGCGNAYLTFAAHRFLTAVRGLPVALTGVDTKTQSRDHNRALSAELGLSATFLADSIAAVDLAPAPEVVLALHACDTATDDALARAVEWEAPLVLAAPCCHHDIAAQLRRAGAPSPYASLTRDGILRERFADTLTDALRSLLLRLAGYRVEVVEFVDSAHTPRNTLLRAVRTGRGGDARVRGEYDELVRAWGIRPRLGVLLGSLLGLPAGSAGDVRA
ncbi:MAG: SAM-dependent methyltransferase [Nocardioidaceae bacterium]